MASGIVSVAAGEHGYWRIGLGLRVLASVIFALLVVLLLVALLSRAPGGWPPRRAHMLAAGAPRRGLQLTRDPDVALRMFTFVAACAVLASCWRASQTTQWALGGLALAGWLSLGTATVALLRGRPLVELRDQAHGAWLLPSVATQGLSITAADLAARTGLDWLLVTACLAWALGLLLYLPILWLIIWRVLSRSPRPELVTPDSWILMGALAIATLASGTILQAARSPHLPAAGLAWTAHLATLAAWVAASLWIPPLLYAEIWRVDQLAGSLRYTRTWWSAVFPIGMYSAATSTAAELGLPALRTIALVVFWNAFIVWTLVAFGRLRGALPTGADRR